MSFGPRQHMLPDAIFPDVIDWDELRTGERHEGIYYGAKNFIRKLTTAFALFVALQVLGWLGYQQRPRRRPSSGSATPSSRASIW